MKLFLGIIKPRATSSILVEKGSHIKNSLEQVVSGIRGEGFLYLKGRQKHSLALPQPGPLRNCLCIPGTGCAGVSSHRGHRWHTSWHRSCGRVSDSGTGSDAQGLEHPLNLNGREEQAALQSWFFQDGSKHGRTRDAALLSPFCQFDPRPSQAFSSTASAFSPLHFLFPTGLPLYVSLTQPSWLFNKSFPYIS